MAQPAQSTQEPNLARGRPTAGPLPHASTAHRGTARPNALSTGTGLMSAHRAFFAPAASFLKIYARASCSEEPGAGKPPAGICEGGVRQLALLPRQWKPPS